MKSVLFTEPAAIKASCERVLGDGGRLPVTFITHTQVRADRALSLSCLCSVRMTSPGRGSR
jgi:hypothetical protein